MLQYLVQKYVGLERRESEARELLDQLIDAFREDDDATALQWLANEFRRRSGSLSPTERSVVTDICDALLGNREKLYWPAFEMRYRGPGTSEIKSFTRADARELHDRLVEYWEGTWNVTDERTSWRNGDVPLLKVLHHWKRTRAQIAHGIVDKLGLRGLAARDGEVLIDLPPRGKDQIRNVYVNDLPQARMVAQP